ncbi:MAG TPA: tryptophan synthase subunit beta [Phycisphaerae bacterium]|nr:tryptophan synthase subunit beta [Phycisphaerae bacterium]HPS53574.1 tryptophan synthase subunit beta [Phycisphaerae bacterium]
MSGCFGQYGGQHVPPQLKAVLDELAKAFNDAWNDESFKAEYYRSLKEIANRPSMLYLAKNLTAKLGGAKIYLKREDLNHLGAHKINNTLGQGLLARRMGKKRLIAETGAGMHGAATAATAAVLGMECEVHMGAVDVKRQEINVMRMELMGTKVVPVTFGQQTLAEAVDSAIAAWMEHIDDTFYVLGSVCGPHPYPLIVREFQKIIGEETRRQMLETEGRLPDYAIACVGGGSNAAGMFYSMLEDSTKLIGVEAMGRGPQPGQHAASMTLGKLGILHGSKCYLIQNEDGTPGNVYSISAGLDYPGVGPEHCQWKDSGRVQYESATDDEAIDALVELCRTEGILPAVESAHAVAYAIKLAPTLGKDKIIVINLSGRGDKDCMQIRDALKQRGKI